ncbi:MAG: RdgB/HAM1 family non-canonical purine NTP pyrophosphatase [Oligoflexia bacterium]|nr:RdgB/HAM1 family non-canonical purine NTP pyrophosphatase [Oligoflexia bacterium]
MIPTITLASSNAHKLSEFQEIFAKTSKASVVAAPSSLSVIEDGATYHENALLKACAYYQKFKVPIVADDSGLEVAALPGELGVLSARFGGNIASSKKCELLLSKMQTVPPEKRQAYFICVLCYYRSPQEIFFFEGRVDGEIAYELKGEHGFGFDPIFLPMEATQKGDSLAMLPEWKQEHSHRARAIKRLLHFL